MKPIIGMTMGDPAGIGSEIIAKALSHDDVYDRCRPIVIGDLGAMEEAVKIAGLDFRVRGVKQISDARFEPGVIDVYDLDNIKLEKVPFGQVNAECGRAAGEYIEKAIELAMDREIAAMVTGPINKESFDMGGYGKKYRGHTEMLAALTKSEKVCMVLASGKLRVIHVTTHVSMRQAVDQVKKQRVLEVIHQAVQSCRELGVDNPRIGVCGLNPHSSDGGIMGHEEAEEIIPAIEQARAEGINVDGPIPGDTIYPRGNKGTYDIIVAMYHDQGHIPVKLAGFLWDGEAWSSVSGVNITVGLPIIRVSVDHGTAFGKAGKGIADERSVLDSIEYAILIAKNRNMI